MKTSKKQKMAAVLAARFLRIAGDYYKLKPRTPLREVIRRWAEDGDKVYDDSMPTTYSPRDLDPYVEFRWSRETSREGYARVKGKTVELSGPLKWDAIAEDMKIRGWDPDEPLYFEVGRDGTAKVGEGNHRLAIAKEIGLKRIPVWFHFKLTAPKDEYDPRKPVEVVPKAIEKVVVEQKRDPKPTTPEEEKQIDDIMDLLGF
jgi:hypothetical protein